MKRAIHIFFVIVLLFLWGGAALGQDTLRVADLGDFSLENGQVIRDCRLAYRTFGILNADKSNAVLFPTWLAGTTQELIDLGLIGPGKMADSSKYFIVAVDAFGNGVSSSPSNSKRQQGQAFPRFSIRDLVKAQHLLLTGHLKVPRLYGIIGISMGGMAAFQWMVFYPDFLGKAVAIVGTPRLTSYDLLLWQAELNAIEAARDNPQGKSAAMKALAAIHQLHLWTPRFISAKTPPENFAQYLSAAEEGILKYNASDWAAQLNAIMDHDISRTFGRSMEGAAKAVRARALIIWAQQDLAVNPEPSQTFAGLLQADTFVLTGDCGHLAFLCEGEILRERVRRFLD